MVTKGLSIVEEVLECVQLCGEDHGVSFSLWVHDAGHEGVCVWGGSLPCCACDGVNVPQVDFTFASGACVSMRVDWVGCKSYSILEGVVSMAYPGSLEVRAMSLPGDVWEV